MIRVKATLAQGSQTLEQVALNVGNPVRTEDLMQYYEPTHYRRLQWVQPSLSTNSNDGPRLLEEYARSMANLDGPPYHYECLLEAQQPSKGVPCPETLIGRFPLEIREQIYIYAFKLEYLPNHLSYCHGRRFDPEPYAEYDRSRASQDHMPVSRAYAQRRWPRGYDASAPHPELMATFPPRFATQARSRLDLLLTCCQIYTEAWRLFYSTNHFDFGTAVSMLHFAKKSIPARR